MTRDYLYREYVKKGRSIKDIALEQNTYPNKIRRLLKKHNIPVRSKSEAQKLALANGTAIHPTQGKQRDEVTKVKISNGVAKVWEEMDEAERESRSEAGRKQYESMTPRQLKEFRSAAAKALREASVNGSKLEKFLLKALRDQGYEVHFHREGVIGSEKLEVDLLVPHYKVAIEIDGPTHFSPIWGHESLSKHQHADQRKTGLLLGSGYTLVRIKHVAKHLSEKHKRDVADFVLNVLSNIGTLKDKLLEFEVT